VETVLCPRLRGLPVIVKGPGEHRTVVAAASYEARAYGVKAAMPVMLARKLCPHGQFVVGMGEVYADFSKRVFDICGTFTTLIEPASIDEGYLDMTPKWTGDEAWPMRAAEQLKTTVKQHTGLTCSVGIGSNKLIAKMASGYAKPNGIARIFPSYEATFLAPLPVEKLPGIGPSAVAALAPLGVKTIGDLQRMPINWLKGIFGVIGEDFFYLASGLGSDDIEDSQDPKSISRGRTLQRNTRSVSELRRVMRELISDLGRHLRKLGFSGRQVTVRVRYSDFKTVGHSRPVENFTDQDREIFALACRLLDELYDRRRPVRLISVGLSDLTKHPIRQRTFWDDGSHEKYRDIYTAMDTLRDRYGPEMIAFAGDTFYSPVIHPPST